MTDLAPVLAALDAGQEDALARLFDLIRIKSISTDPAYRDECRRAGQWLVDELAGLGFAATLNATQGHPVVTAHHDGDGPHVLFYGHYDVQPVDPEGEWAAPPFQPRLEERDGRMVIAGRGAADDKGQLMTFLEACRAFKTAHGRLPCRVSVILEGEEESGSPSIVPFLAAHGAALKADHALVCDTNMWDRATPSISVGLRGLMEEEIIVTAANRDLHSGYYGGAAANPIHILAKILADLHDGDGRVTIPGFYDGVDETPPDILAMWNGLGRTPQNFLGEIGLAIPAGEKGRSLLELTWARPTAEVNGIIGGYTGEGFKTVIPSRASAKISCRLVHRQDPETIRTAFRAFVTARVPADCQVAFINHGGAPATQLPYDSPVLARTRAALTAEWGKDTVMACMGGSIPIVGLFQSMLGMDSVMVGFGLGDDRIHSPNEKYDLTSFHKGARSWARILAALAP